MYAIRSYYEPTLLKDVQSIIDNAIEKGFVKDYEVDIERIVENEGIILEKDFEIRITSYNVCYTKLLRFLLLLLQR